tara:strand:- start:99 stop:488 length:390 start_codon:yes stop_codon:yes gene_type:complete
MTFYIISLKNRANAYEKQEIEGFSDSNLNDRVFYLGCRQFLMKPSDAALGDTYSINIKILRTRAYARAYAKYRDQMTDLQARTLSAVIATDWTSNREEIFKSDLEQDGTESMNRQPVFTCACGNSEKKQ